MYKGFAGSQVKCLRVFQKNLFTCLFVIVNMSESPNPHQDILSFATNQLNMLSGVSQGL
jgi:hypothetical protein